MVVFHWAFSLNMQNWQFSRTGFAHFGATPASDRFDRERTARGIDFDAVGKARLIENRANIDPHSLRERESTFFMKRRKVVIVYHIHGELQEALSSLKSQVFLGNSCTLSWRPFSRCRFRRVQRLDGWSLVAL
jgi:hypothetical protein